MGHNVLSLPRVPAHRAPQGMLDFEEIAASMNMTKSADATPEQEATRQEFINSHIKRFDTDGDGKVSYAEGWGAFNKRMVELVTMDKAEL